MVFQVLWNIVNIIGLIISIQLYVVILGPAVNHFVIRRINYAWSVRIQHSPWSERFFKYVCCVPYAVFMTVPEFQRKMKMKSLAQKMWMMQVHVVVISTVIMELARDWNGGNQIDVLGMIGLLWILMLHRPDDDHRRDDDEYPDVPDEPEDHTVDESWGGLADSYIRSLQHKVTAK